MGQRFLTLYSKFFQKFLKSKKPPRLAGQWSRLARPLKVVFDCSNGVAGLVLKQLKTGEIKTYFINEKPDGNFPAHGPNPLNPGATNQLQAAVKKNKADLGIIFDADADRMFCIDDKSRFINPDAIARILAWQLKPKKIIIDVSTGWLVKKLQVTSYKLQVIESKVGHYFIKKMMRAENADFGAEHSGHYYFKNFFGLDSGILAAIEVINAVSELPYKLSDFIELLPKYYHQEINIRYQESGIRNQEIFKKIEKKYLLLNTKYLIRISHLDGLTMEFENKIGPASRSLGEGWWFNLRFSQTESLLRLNIETTEKSKFQKEVSKLKKFLQLAAR